MYLLIIVKYMNSVKYLIIAILSFSCIHCYAEDIIVLRNGSIIKSVVSEVSQKEIKYKKASNPSGPTYTIDKSSVLSITYENGDSDNFMDEVSTNVSSSDIDEPRYIERKIDVERNNTLLQQYRRPHDSYSGKKAENKTAKKGTAFFAFTSNSVLSNEDIEVSFIPVWQHHFYPSGDFLKEALDKYGIYYKITITNKTAQTIYIDCANCFIIDNSGNYTSFYDNRTYSKSTGGSKSGIFNLGGVTNALGVGGVAGSLANATTLGASTNSGLTVSENDERVIAIPPSGVMPLPQKRYVGKKETFKRYEYFPRPYYHQISMKKWTPQYFEEGDLPSYLKFIFTYSLSPNFTTFSSIKSELYCYEIMGQLFDDTVNYQKLDNAGSLIIFKRMDDNKPLYAPIYDQTSGKPKY